MFDLKGKSKLKISKNCKRVINKLESGKCLYIENLRTLEKYKLSFKKVNGYCYKVLSEFDNYGEIHSKEFKLSTKDNNKTLVHNKMVLYINLEDSKLTIIAPEEFIFYE